MNVIRFTYINIIKLQTTLNSKYETKLLTTVRKALPTVITT